MKKILVVLIVLMITLSGCGLFHEHEWTEATCVEPKQCSQCDKTVGSELGHDYSQANFQTAATCSTCGDVWGDVLEADFEKYDLEINSEADIDGYYEYYTCGNGEPDVEVVGHLFFYEYNIFSSDESHEAKEGYEWRTVSVKLEFSDENVLAHGAKWCTSWDDYYTIKKHDHSADAIDEEGTTYKFTVNYNGVDYEECLFIKELTHSGWKGNTYLITYEFSFQVPIGYDGCVICFYHGATEWKDGDYIFDVADEDTVFFRLK